MQIKSLLVQLAGANPQLDLEIDKTVNKWLSDNASVDVIDIKIAPELANSRGKALITILFEQAKKSK